MSLLTTVRETVSGFKSLLIGMRITAREAAKPIITVQYPHDTLPMPGRFRGHIKLVLDPETGRPKCTACTLCAKACPSGCIELDGVRREGDKKKSVSKYDLDFTKCSLCGSCVEVCPSDAIEFSREYNVVSFNRETFGDMDLRQKIEAEAAEWAKSHPQPVAPVVAPVAGLAEPGTPGSPTPATTQPASAGGRTGNPLPAGTTNISASATDGAERSPHPITPPAAKEPAA
jgi:NADH-quinone oxidoreductase subunit I